VLLMKCDDNFDILIEGQRKTFAICYDKEGSLIKFQYDGQVQKVMLKKSDVDIELYLDASSLECFINQGEVSFSSRMFLGEESTFICK
ncbi:GH32 C-terminal domain-containing protein, partial [Escherichia coli]|uniref:GH32 C-terminal domain-containing protein n=1 Tax=Escherichia coli TaxID=562 RepID=UPI002859781F